MAPGRYWVVETLVNYRRHLELIGKSSSGCLVYGGLQGGAKAITREEPRSSGFL